MRSKNQYNILKILSDSASGIMEFAIAINRAEYGASQNMIRMELDNISENKFLDSKEKELLLKSKKCCYATVTSLLKDGLVRKEGFGRKIYLAITKKGKERLNLLEERAKINLSPTKSKSLKKKSDRVIIISYDISEKESWKRLWLRKNLINLGFIMIQKSVWCGKVQLPHEFIDDLKTLNLIEKVQIFSPDKLGTLKLIQNL
jgi:DNA-binding PadR family transcriptional regulator